ncbi:hypothetical protein ACHAXT_011983 [Thalassiosira profunda]
MPPARSIAALLLLCLARIGPAHSFAPPQKVPITRNHRAARRSTLLAAGSGGEDNNKFSFFQRIESTKTALLGLVSGGILSTPFIALHDIPAYGAASWEFDTDMGSLQSALFAIVYRYCVREEDDNEMLNQGVVGAFVVTRTLSRVRVPSYCTAAPLECGDPLGYFDWDMIQQLVLNGLESVALFGGAALAMEYAYGKKWISKFPN